MSHVIFGTYLYQMLIFFFFYPKFEFSWVLLETKMKGILVTEWKKIQPSCVLLLYRKQNLQVMDLDI